jgi:endoglucanase
VGDRLSTFDPELTRLLSDAAGALAARTPAFRSQRALMDGGSCESTAYNAWGIRAGGACLALGNYHNQGARGGIEPEYVDWHDLEGLVALLVESARRFGDGSAARPLRDRLLLGFRRDESLLDASARRILARPGRKAAAGRRTR